MVSFDIITKPLLTFILPWGGDRTINAAALGLLIREPRAGRAAAHNEKHPSGYGNGGWVGTAVAGQNDVGGHHQHATGEHHVNNGRHYAAGG